MRPSRAGLLLSTVAHVALAAAIVAGSGARPRVADTVPLAVELIAIAPPTPMPPASAAPPMPVAPRFDAALASAIAEPTADPIRPAPDLTPRPKSPRRQVAIAPPRPTISQAPTPALTATPATPTAPTTAPLTGTTTAATEATIASAPSRDWLRDIVDWLASHRTYPEQARREGEQGTVVLRLVIARDGTVRAATLLQGSGHADLDRASLADVSGARLPPSPSPDAPAEITLRVPIRYALETPD